MKRDIIDWLEILKATHPNARDVYREAIDTIRQLRIENRAVKDAYEHLAEISKSQRETMTKYLFQEEQK